MLPFATGITGYCAERNGVFSLELRSLRNLQTVNFKTQDQTVIDTIKQGFSPILGDYLGDSLPGFGDTFLEMQSHSIPVAGEERDLDLKKNLKMKFCWIPEGEAILGSPENEKGRWKDEVEHEFKTNGFWMGKYQVTQTQWEAVMCNNPSYFQGANLPVECVSWNDCQDFIKKCNASILKPRLPHEDQWEYACRGGRGNKQAFYWGNELSGDKANCNGYFPYNGDNEFKPYKKMIYLDKTTEVGSYEKIAPHPWGLCDMSGNVWEWCRNFHTEKSLSRTYRGGSWVDLSVYCRSAYRLNDKQSYQDSSLGLRLIIC